jgi:regulator of nucleoside diphosphate kinase
MMSPALRLPPITVTTEDIRYLNVLALSGARHAESLVREIERANVIPPHQALPGLVRMVYPHEIDEEANRVSVLTPVGVALIGLSVGQTIEFETTDRKKRSLTVVDAQD